MMKINDAPVVQLSNGLRVANFSSPHPFTFVTGETLGPCAPERAKALMLEAVEVETPGIKPGIVDIALTFRLTPEVETALDALESDESVDIIIVPLPVMTALKAVGRDLGKARCIRSADRITKAIYADKFCV